LKGHSPDYNYDYCRNIEFFSWWAPFKCSVKGDILLVIVGDIPLLAIVSRSNSAQLNSSQLTDIYIYIFDHLQKKRCSEAIPCLDTSFGKLLRNKNSYFMAIKAMIPQFQVISC